MSEQIQPMPAPLTGRSLVVCLLAGLAAVVVVAAVCSFIGQYHVEWPLWESDTWKLRLLQLAAAALVGAGLSAAGMALQALLRNSLAEPYILGISSGAGVGVLAASLVPAAWGMSAWFGKSAMTLVGALATCMFVYGIAQRRGRLNPYVLLLTGVIVNVFNGALMLAMLMFIDRNQIVNFVSWGMGGIIDQRLVEHWLVVACAAGVVVGWGVLFLRGAAFNMLGLGDEVAASSGVRVHWLRVETFAVAGLITSAAVALAGPVGFIGLIVPHICRLVVGPDHRRLVIVCGFAGAVVLMVADTFCRTAGEWLGTGDIPVGVLMAMTGGPFFIWLLRRKFKAESA